jgi:glucose 1-dehydrogenase
VKKLSNKNILITGGSSGIGQAIAIACAKEGAHIAFSYHSNSAGAQQTVTKIKEMGSKVVALSVDMNNESSVYQLIEDAIQHLAHIDILVNNAGMLTRHKTFFDISLDCFDQIQAVNVRAPFILIQKIARHMQAKGILGSILNISSVSVEITTPGLMHYECSKAALNALTRSAASELAAYGIRVNAIAPGLVETNINAAQRKNDPDAWIQRSEKIPLGRAGLPDDIAGLSVFLVSDAASWITGSIMTVDGGIGVMSPFAKKVKT